MKTLFALTLLTLSSALFAGSITGKVLVQKMNYKINYDIVADLQGSQVILKGGTRIEDTKNIRSSDTVKATQTTDEQILSMNQNATLEYLSNSVNVEGELFNSYTKGVAYYSKNLSRENTLETNHGDRCLFYFDLKGMHLDTNCRWNGVEIQAGELISFSSKSIYTIDMQIDNLCFSGQMNISDVVTKERNRGQVYTKNTAKLMKLYVDIDTNSEQKVSKLKAAQSFLSILQIYSKRLFR